MAKFVLRNYYFEFIGETKQEIFGTAVGTSGCRHLSMHVYSWTKLNQNF